MHRRHRQHQNRFRTALANLSRLLPRSSLPNKEDEDMNPFNDPFTQTPPPPPAPPPRDTFAQLPQLDTCTQPIPMQCSPAEVLPPLSFPPPPPSRLPSQHVDNPHLLFATPETTLSSIPHDTPSSIPIPPLPQQTFRLPSVIHITHPHNNQLPLHHQHPDFAGQQLLHHQQFHGLTPNPTQLSHPQQSNSLPSMYQQAWHLPPVTTLPQPHNYPQHTRVANLVNASDSMLPATPTQRLQHAPHPAARPSPTHRHSRLARMARDARARDARYAQEIFGVTRPGPANPPREPIPDLTTAEQELAQLKRLIESGHAVQPSNTTPPASSAAHASRGMPSSHRTPRVQSTITSNARGRRDSKHRSRRGGATPTGKLPKHPSLSTQIQPTLQQGIRRPPPRQSRQRIIKILNLTQAPATWYGSVVIAQNGAKGGVSEVKVPVAAFSYTLRTKPAFTAALPAVVKLGNDTIRKFDDVVDSASRGSFLVRLSPVNDYGQTVGNNLYAGFVRECLVSGKVHEVGMDGGKVLLFPLMFPQVGLCFVGIFVAS